MILMKSDRRTLARAGLVLAPALAGILAILYAVGVLFSPVDRESSPQLLSPADRAKVERYFVRLAEHINRHHYELDLIYNRSIYQGGYLMRTLVAAYEITDREEFLLTAVRFADELVNLQRKDGYWVVADHGNIYLADTGSALGLLMILYKHVDDQRQALYFQSIKTYADAVIQDGLIRESGALDVGWYATEDGGMERGQGPFTISTALTGVEVFAWLYHETGSSEYKEIATNALNWLLDSMRDDGVIPYIFPERGADLAKQDDPEAHHYLWERRRYTTSTYVGEAMSQAYTFLDDQAMQALIREQLKEHIEMVLRTQN